MLETRIATAGTRYYAALEDVKKKRQQWDEQVKDVIRRTLESCVVLSGIELEVVAPAEYRNHESVIALFPDVRGIFTHPFQGEAEVIQRGAQLIFQQLKNGNIIVVALMPTLDGIGLNTNEEHLDIMPDYPPINVTKDLVIDHFIGFIDAVTQWELSRMPHSTNRIGF